MGLGLCCVNYDEADQFHQLIFIAIAPDAEHFEQYRAKADSDIKLDWAAISRESVPNFLTLNPARMAGNLGSAWGEGLGNAAYLNRRMREAGKK